jgi:membrane-associated phospholipid phosphatase
MWIFILGVINLILLIFALKFLIPKEFLISKKTSIFQNIKSHLPYILIIFGVVAFHLFEVNIIDPHITEWIGADYASAIRGIEGDTVIWFSQHWTPVLVYFFVIIYIAVYPFTLWFAPLYFLWTDNKKPLKTLTYGLLLIYIIALPFYLFLPITNVYSAQFYSGAHSALETVIPDVEQFFYSTTTQNNCLPSLHTAMTILIAWSVRLTGNKRFTYFAYFTMISVIISVIYLSIHWITDVITGALLAVGVIFILNRYIKEE